MSMSPHGTASAQETAMMASVSKPGMAQGIAALALIPGAPIMALTAIVTFLLVGRPLLFRQVRSGMHGRPFEILKFRTMTSGTDSSGHLLPDEQRTTFATRFLRRTRLDETPQLISILRGDMAIVGPRPLLPETISAMGALGQKRCSTRPGLTGWSQVNGNTLLNNQQKLALDLWYVDHRSWWLDLQILARTVLTVLFGERIHADHLAIAEEHVAKLTQQMTEQKHG